MSLKPKDLGVTNKQLDTKELTKILDKSIDKQAKDPVQTYLGLLVELYQDPKNDKIKKQITDVYQSNKPKITARIGEIKNDFGEVLGGIATINEQLLKPFYSKVDFRKGKLEYPVAANEPLKDYSVFVGKEEYIISAKISGSVSNTVKPQDILGLVARSRALTKDTKKRLMDTVEYQVLEVLGKENTLFGPGAAISYFRDKMKDRDKIRVMNTYIDITKFPSFQNYSREFGNINQNISTTQRTSKIYNGKIFQPILNSKQWNEYVKDHNVNPKIVNWADLVLYFEWVIFKASKDKPKALDFGGLFLDAITSQIHYIKLTFDLKTGIPTFDAHATVKPPTGKNISNFRADDIFIRSKSSRYNDGRYRLKDKIGIQT